MTMRVDMRHEASRGGTFAPPPDGRTSASRDERACACVSFWLARGGFEWHVGPYRALAYSLSPHRSPSDSETLVAKLDCVPLSAHLF